MPKDLVSQKQSRSARLIARLDVNEWFNETVEILLNLPTLDSNPTGVSCDERAFGEGRYKTAIRYALLAAAAVCRSAHVDAVAGESVIESNFDALVHVFTAEAHQSNLHVLKQRLNVAVHQLQAQSAFADSDLLANLYESILSKRPRHVDGRYVLHNEPNAKRRTGTFYTPDSLADLCAQNALHELLHDENGCVKTPVEILAFRIVDPSVGGGSLLRAAMNYLAAKLQESIALHGYDKNAFECFVSKPDLTGGKIQKPIDLAFKSGVSTGARESFDSAFEPGVQNAARQVRDSAFESDVSTPGRKRLESALEPVISKFGTEYIDASLVRSSVAINCLYGVDIDEQAVELSILSIWLATGCDARINFFARLREHIKCGNALIGCWTVDLRDLQLPKALVRAHNKKLIRIDSSYETSKITGEEKRAQTKFTCEPAIRTAEATAVPVSTVQKLPEGGVEPRFPRVCPGLGSAADGDQQVSLRRRMNLWCALWFWPEHARMPSESEFADPDDTLLEWADKISIEQKFFHWELEFPEVFDDASGFDACVGNPPWEISKPNSREFFSRFDLSFWSYGKQEAIQKQRELCREFPDAAQLWNEYQRNYECFAAWVKSGVFRFQGKSDLNAYKLFLERAHRVLRSRGFLSLIVPAGLYSDLGTRDLRKLFLERCKWHSLLGFDNRKSLFDIHRSFKFCIATVEKDGFTEAVQARFLITNPSSVSDIPDASRSMSIRYSSDAVRSFSPVAYSLVEFEHERDMQVLEKIYRNNPCLKEGWNVQFEREFDMTNDSAKFLQRDRIESLGFRADEYGHWLSGPWEPAADAHLRNPEFVYSHDRNLVIEIAKVVEIALPLYEGRMIGQFDFCEKQWIGGKGRTAEWRGSAEQFPMPQYLMSANDYWHRRGPKSGHTAVADRYPDSIKCGFLGVGSPSNARSMIASAILDWPCGNSVPAIRTACGDPQLLNLIACLNSYVFDFAIRNRMSGNNLNYFLVQETPLPPPNVVRQVLQKFCVSDLTALLNLSHVSFAEYWASHNSSLACGDLTFSSTDERFRRTARALLDAVIAHAYGLDFDDMCWILRGATAQSKYKVKTVKGFWRCEKEVPDEERHATKTLKFVQQLQEGKLTPSFLADELGISGSDLLRTGKASGTLGGFVSSVTTTSQATRPVSTRKASAKPSASERDSDDVIAAGADRLKCQTSSFTSAESASDLPAGADGSKCQTSSFTRAEFEDTASDFQLHAARIKRLKDLGTKM